MIITKLHLKDLIANGKTEQAIEQLLKISSQLDKDLQEDILIQSAKFKTYQKERLQGTTSKEELHILLIQINQALIAIINDLPEGNLIIITNNRKKTYKWGISVAVIICLLVIVAELINIINIFPNGRGTSMQLTVYVQGLDGKPIAEIQNEGKIIVDFGNDRRAPLIGENGRTNLGEIPEKFHGETIPIILDAEGYEPAEPTKQYIMDGKPIYFLVKRDNSLGIIQGIVKDRSGETFIANALVMIDQDTTTITDSLGRFYLLMPADKHKDTYTLTIKKESYKVKSEYYKPKSGSIEIRLD